MNALSALFSVPAAVAAIVISQAGAALASDVPGVPRFRFLHLSCRGLEQPRCAAILAQ
jgi:hypothetical protein